MKLSISNLAFGQLPIEAIIPELEIHQINGLEFAPTKQWPEFPKTDFNKLKNFRSMLNHYGIQISAFQSLFYGLPHLQVLNKNDWPEILNHLKRIIGVASELDVKILVLGAPRNRLRINVSPKNADQIFSEFINLIEPFLQDSQILMTLEPNPNKYGADYLTTYYEVVKSARELNSPWVKAQMDTGCMLINQESLSDAFHLHKPAHLHVSSGNINEFPIDLDHKHLTELIKSSDYKGWVVLEIISGEEMSLSRLRNFLIDFKVHYNQT